MERDLITTLGALNGEELYNLIIKLRSSAHRLQYEAGSRKITAARRNMFLSLMSDAMQYENDALIQVARIHVPLKEATSIIARESYRRHYPQKVAGT